MDAPPGTLPRKSIKKNDSSRSNQAHRSGFGSGVPRRAIALLHNHTDAELGRLGAARKGASLDIVYLRMEAYEATDPGIGILVRGDRHVCATTRRARRRQGARAATATAVF
jgi:hypothetical protein